MIMKGWPCASSSSTSLAVLGLINLAVVAAHSYSSTADCEIPAIYNFGDSNSDTGSDSAAFSRVPYPYGITYFGKPSGRYTDGRLIIDFIAGKMGLPYLSSYLDAIEGNFKHGANFAAAGTTIHPVDGKLYESLADPFALNIQLLQFQQLKERTEELYAQARNSIIKSRLPRPEEFSKALYTLDIGQNDLAYKLTVMTEDQVRESLPDIINHLAFAIQKLYQLQGARTFWIHNTGPLGCLPNFLGTTPSHAGRFDIVGCVKSYNEIAEEFNRLLKEVVSELQAQHQDALLVYVDIYSAKYSLIKGSKENGFTYPFGYCCKNCASSFLPIWKRQMVNETVVDATPCDDPSEYISWDGVHYTEAANRLIADMIYDGSFSDPPVPITRACPSQVGHGVSKESRSFAT